MEGKYVLVGLVHWAVFGCWQGNMQKHWDNSGAGGKGLCKMRLGKWVGKMGVLQWKVMGVSEEKVAAFVGLPHVVSRG